MTHVLPFNFHFQVIIIQDHQSWSIYNEFIHWFLWVILWFFFFKLKMYQLSLFHNAISWLINSLWPGDEYMHQ